MLIAMRGTTPTGTAYTEDRPEFRAHHAKYSESCVWMPGLALEFDDMGRCTTELSFVQQKEVARALIAHARWLAETGGCTVQGMTIRTDRESQAMITGAALKAMQDAEYTCSWKADSGFVELAAPQILAIADAVRAHVQSCFDRERALLALIDAAGTPEDLEPVTW
jgi:hypothetical protein